MKTVAQTISLAELGMDSIMAVEIKQTLEREFDVFLNAQDIRNISFAKLSEMHSKEMKREKPETETVGQVAEVPGIQLLMRIMNNENVTSEICMELPTRRDPRKVEVFLLPGIEGCGHIFNPLAPKIRPIATCLQYGTNNIGLTHTSIPEYADKLLPVGVYETIRSITKMNYSLDILLTF